MKTYTSEELKEILDLHKKWLNADKDGVRARLNGANLIGARLIGVNLIGARLSGANLSGANLNRARLNGANLDGANLSGARLNGANLDRANLDRANLDRVLGNLRHIKTIQCERYYVSYTYKTLNIGCESHSIEDWKNFSDEQISEMGRDALEWWNKWKPILMNIIEVSPCEACGGEE